MSVDSRIANLDGDAALPRKNGELVFNAPWEGHAFGIAVVMNEKDAFAWDDFRTGLVDQIATGQPDYYQCWLHALESLLVARGIVTREEVENRAHQYRSLERDPLF